MNNIDSIKLDYPVHWLVWNNDFQELEEFINKTEPNLELLDPRGRTPLMLAVKLCHLQSVKVLLNAKCNANTESGGWSVVQEAVCTSDPAILNAVLEVRDLQRHIKRVMHVPQILQRLHEAPDFYVEMKWEFTSWVPLMSNICPSDVYKVYKRGSNVRIDTTLLGFDATSWQRGNRSYIFKGQNDVATMIEVDHDAQEVSIEKMRSAMPEIKGVSPSSESINARLNAPVTANHIDIDKISFERNKSGIWGWRSEKTETINNYECKVYAASNVEFITKTRTEHLNESQANTKNSRTPLQSFFGIAEEETNKVPETEELIPAIDDTESVPAVQQQQLTAEEYFSEIDLQGRDVGRTMKINTKIQKFRANLWLSEDFPIKLQEQVLPILDLMSTMASPHVSKLKDFITMQLPAGFPIKIEIPLFHVLNACVTFGNVFATETPIDNVSYLNEDSRLTCVIDDSCFDIPSNYVRKGQYRRPMTLEDEDDLVQFAIQQSLIESGSENDEVDIWEALRGQRPVTPIVFSDEDSQLQRALHESFLGINKPLKINFNEEAIGGFETVEDDEIDADLEMALRLSKEEQRNSELQSDKEQRLFEEVLRLSLKEK